jgi:hypothetical protein
LIRVEDEPIELRNRRGPERELCLIEEKKSSGTRRLRADKIIFENVVTFEDLALLAG